MTDGDEFVGTFEPDFASMCAVTLDGTTVVQSATNPIEILASDDGTYVITGTICDLVAEEADDALVVVGPDACVADSGRAWSDFEGTAAWRGKVLDLSYTATLSDSMRPESISCSLKLRRS